VYHLSTDWKQCGLINCHHFFTTDFAYRWYGSSSQLWYKLIYDIKWLFYVLTTPNHFHVCKKIMWTPGSCMAGSLPGFQIASYHIWCLLVTSGFRKWMNPETSLTLICNCCWDEWADSTEEQQSNSQSITGSFHPFVGLNTRGSPFCLWPSDCLIHLPQVKRGLVETFWGQIPNVTLPYVTLPNATLQQHFS